MRLRFLPLTVILFACGDEPTKSTSDDTAEPISDGPSLVDSDGDGWSVEDGDCDDSDASIFPGAVESCNGIDDNCNNTVDEGFTDSDSDTIADCIDEEECDGIDNDGDGEIDEGSPDSDGDTIADCVDEEECDGIDNDGDGEIDEDFDQDADGFSACEDAAEWDCDDNDPNTNPAASENTTDGADNDCDWIVDEDDSGFVQGAVVITEIMNNPQNVADTYGEWFEVYNPTINDLHLNGLIIMDDAGSEKHRIMHPEALVLPAGGYMVLGNNADLSTNGGYAIDYSYSNIGLSNENDTLILAYSQLEIDRVAWDDGASMPDLNGNTMQLDPYFADASSNDSSVNWCEQDAPSPGAENFVCENVDHDGDGVLAADGDCDDYDASLQNLDSDGDGYSTCDGDCDDNDPIMLPVDTDGDSISTCDGDCNGNDPSIGATDMDADGFIACVDDCDDNDASVSFVDADGDGADCFADCDESDPSLNVSDADGDGYSTCSSDCDDADASIYPGATEIADDGIDQDCDGGDLISDPLEIDDDGDSYTENQGDCDDTDASIYPGATEIVADGIDQDCDGSDALTDPLDSDDDGDSYTENQGDCDDADASIYPGATEVYDDGIDQDCDGSDATSGSSLTWADVQPSFSSCTGCHGSSGNFTLSYANMVNVNSSQLSSMALIAPNSTADSYVWHKIVGTHSSVGGSGSAMPLGSSMSQSDIDTIETWINDGALQ